jgi:hypothetical protein
VSVDIEAVGSPARWLIENQNLAPLEHSSRETEELPLAMGQEIRIHQRVEDACDAAVLVRGLVLEDGPEADLLQRLGDRFIGRLGQRVGVGPYRAREEERVLGEADDPFADDGALQGRQVDVIEDDPAGDEINHAHYGER